MAGGTLVTKRSLLIPLIVLGFSGMIAQIILLRELLVSFYGNELSIGIVLANWLVLEAAGSLLGRRIESKKRKLEVYIILQFAFCIGLPACILSARLVKNITGAIPGEGLGIGMVMFSSFLILLLPASVHGALFTSGCSILADQSGRKARAIGMVYLYEIMGTTAGGIVLTFLLLYRFQSFRIVFMLIALSMIASLILLHQSSQGLNTNPVLALVSLLFLAGSLMLIMTNLDERVHRMSLCWQWHGVDVPFYQNSRYGNIAVTRSGDQHTVFSDGVPLFNFPVPDIEHIESLVHLPLLAHPRPADVLIISGGAGGVITEVLKHPVQHVDYVELDPLILEALNRFAPPETLHELSDPRVHVSLTDGRLFLKTTPQRYDVILLGLSDPADLQTNRLFTEEFFAMARLKLKADGMVVVQASGSLSYLSAELKRINASVIRTLESAFPSIALIPGEPNIFLALNGTGVSADGRQLDPVPLKMNLRARGLDVRLVTPFYIDYRLDPKWLLWFDQSMGTVETRPNRDFLPSGVIYGLNLWNAQFSPRAGRLLQVMQDMHPQSLVSFLGASVVLFFAAGIVWKRRALRAAIPLVVFTTGFAGMMFDLVLIFAFQVLYGYIYFLVGALITAFMAGSGLGSFIATSRLDRIEKVTRLFILLDFIIMVFAAVLAVTSLLQHLSTGGWLDHLPEPYFAVLCFTGGFLIGFQFPLANRMHLVFSGKAGETAGLLNGADLIGGFMAGMLGGTLLLPVMGLTGTCVAVIMVKAATCVLFVQSSRERNR